METKRFDIFMFALTKSQKNISALLKKEMSEENISHVEAICIRSVAFNDGGISASEICRMCFYDKALISRTLNHLKEREFICINPLDEHKSRGKRYILTKKGRTISDKMSDFVSKLGTELVRDISDEDVEIFFQTAIKIMNNMQNISVKPINQEAEQEKC